MIPALEEFLRSLTVVFQSLAAFVRTFPASLSPCGSSPELARACLRKRVARGAVQIDMGAL